MLTNKNTATGEYPVAVVEYAKIFKKIDKKCEKQDFSNLKSGRSGLIVTNRLHKICRNYCVVVSERIDMQRF